MPRNVSIPRVGTVAFPDGMSDDEISAAAKKLYDEASAAPATPSNPFADVVGRSSSTAAAPPSVSERAAKNLAGLKAQERKTVSPEMLAAMPELTGTKLDPSFSEAEEAVAEEVRGQPLIDVGGAVRSVSGKATHPLAKVGQFAADLLGELTTPENLLFEVFPGGMVSELLTSPARAAVKEGASEIGEAAAREAGDEAAREAAAADAAKRLRADFEATQQPGHPGYGKGSKDAVELIRRRDLARKKVRENIPLNEPERTEFPEIAAYQATKNGTVVVDPDTGKAIAKNPPASNEAQAALEESLRAKGIDTTDPDAVATALSDEMGLPTPRVTIGGPISKLSREEPRLPRKLNERLALGAEDLKFLNNLSDAMGGKVTWDVIPDQLTRKLKVPGILDSLADELEVQKGQVGRHRSVSETGQETWIAVKSSLPKELQRGYSYQELADMIRIGLAGGELSPKKAAWFRDAEAWAKRQPLHGDEDSLFQALMDNKINFERPVAEEAAERAALQGEATDFDFGENAPAYRADTEAGKPSEILHELRHIEEDLGGRPVTENNDLIVAEHLQGGGQNGPPPPRTPPTLSESPFANRVALANEHLSRVAAKIQDMGQKLNIVGEQKDVIEATGTIEKGRRQLFRETGDKPPTYWLRVSESDIDTAWTEMTGALEEVSRMEREVLRGSAVYRQDAGLEVVALDQARQILKRNVKEWATLRYAFGRGVRAFGRPPSQQMQRLFEKAMSPDTLAQLGEVANLIAKGGDVQARMPLYTNIVRLGRKWTTLTEPEQFELFRDVVSAARLNLFSVFGFTLDLASNVAAGSSEVIGGLGRDLMRVGVKGDVHFPNIGGWVRAVRDRGGAGLEALEVGAKAIAEGKSLRKTAGAFNPKFSDRMAEELGWTAAGEPLRGGMAPQLPGTFVDRSSKAGIYADYFLGAPLYAKSMMDTGAKRLGATAKLWAMAYENVPKGLKGLERKRWIDQFMRDPPESAINEAVAMGQRVSFDRPLTRFEEKVATSPTAQLAVDVFARWPFQFSRWFGETLGLNPRYLQKLVKGKATAEETGEYLIKAASGIGGLMYLKNTMYDQIDFESMEFVHDNGERTRLAGREPLPTAMWLLAAIQGDETRAWAALKHTSLPFARFLSGEGGLLMSLIRTLQRAQQNRDMDADGFNRELSDFFNRLIPGQGILSLVETAIDPTLREGFGANLPGISQALPQRIESTTGEELIPMQRPPISGATAFPAIGGTLIPGFRGQRDPVFGLLSRYGGLVYRGPRTPLAGFPAAEIPQELRRQWQVEFGKQRQALLTEVIVNEQQWLKEFGPLKIMDIIKELDSKAAKIATGTINEKAGNPEVPETVPRRIQARSPRQQRMIEEDIQRRSSEQ